MGRNIFKVRPVINKRNKQIHINLPRRKISKDILKKITKGSPIKVKVSRMWD